MDDAISDILLPLRSPLSPSAFVQIEAPRLAFSIIDAWLPLRPWIGWIDENLLIKRHVASRVQGPSVGT